MFRMAPVRATKKRRTSATAPPAGASSATSHFSDVESEAGGVVLENDTADTSGDEDDKYASAESSEDEDLTADQFSASSEDSGAESDDSISSLVAAQQLNKKKRKRNDPDAFSSSMAKILGSHLTTTARKDPVLVRAKKGAEQADEGKLQAKAKRALKEELRTEKEKGRVRELVPKDDDQAAKKALEKERTLKGIGRSGVAKLYNAVRAAQIKAEEASKDAKNKGIVGMGNREAKGWCFPAGLSWSMLMYAMRSHGDVEAEFLGPRPVVCRKDGVVGNCISFVTNRKISCTRPFVKVKLAFSIYPSAVSRKRKHTYINMHPARYIHKPITRHNYMGRRIVIVQP
jgi:hypothetical protein